MWHLSVCVRVRVGHKSWVFLTTPKDKGGKIREMGAYRGRREETWRKREVVQKGGRKELELEWDLGKREGRRPWGQKQKGRGRVRKEEDKGWRRMGGRGRWGGWEKEKGR